MKKKKILLIPKSNSFEDVAQMYFLEKELVSFGHQVDSLSGPIFDFNMINILNEYNFDVIFRVNAGKPKEFKKKNTRFVSWVKNLSVIKSFLKNYNQDDIIYTIEKEKKKIKDLNIKNLNPAASFSKNHISNLDKNNISNLNYLENIDISHIGNESLFDIYDGQQKIKQEKALEIFHQLNEIINFLANFSLSFKTSFFGLIAPSDKYLKNTKFQFHGPIKNYNFFFEIFKRSKINLINENHDFDFNTKIFNILSTQGLIMFDKVRQKKLIKKMNDLGFFDTESLICYDEKKESEKIFNEFLSDNQKRLTVGKKAQKIIGSFHTYKNRAKQILDDLM
jgi:hypothetical protein